MLLIERYFRLGVVLDDGCCRFVNFAQTRRPARVDELVRDAQCFSDFGPRQAGEASLEHNVGEVFVGHSNGVLRFNERVGCCLQRFEVDVVGSNRVSAAASSSGLSVTSV